MGIPFKDVDFKTAIQTTEIMILDIFNFIHFEKNMIFWVFPKTVVLDYFKHNTFLDNFKKCILATLHIQDENLPELVSNTKSVEEAYLFGDYLDYPR